MACLGLKCIEVLKRENLLRVGVYMKWNFQFT